MSKELFMAAHEQMVEEYLDAHPNATWDEAYEATDARQPGRPHRLPAPASQGGSVTRYHSSRACKWVDPRPHQDASMRYLKHGPVQPMAEEPGFWARLWKKEGRR